MHRCSDAGASHTVTAKSPLQNSAILLHFAKLREIKIKFFSNVLADCCYIIIAAVPYPSRRSKPRNPVLRPAVRWKPLLLLLCVPSTNSAPRGHVLGRPVTAGIGRLSEGPLQRGRKSWGELGRENGVRAQGAGRRRGGGAYGRSERGGD